MAGKKKFSDSPDPFAAAMSNLEKEGTESVEAYRKKKKKEREKLQQQQKGGKFYDLQNLTTAE